MIQILASRLGRPASLLALAALLAGCASKPSSAWSATSKDARYSLWVLGTAQDGGVPHVGCRKECCVTARRNGTRAFPVSLGIVDRESKSLAMIEASPELDAQIALLHALSGLEGRGRNPVDAVILTHAHIGHYAGLVHFGREVASTQKLPVWTSTRMASFLRTNGPWSQLVSLQQIELRDFETRSFEALPGLRIEPVAVPHRDEFSDTMAYKIHGPTRCVLFLPDVDAWDEHPGLLDRLFDGVDVAYIDGTFWDGRELPGRDIREIPHPLIVHSMERLASRAKKAPGSIRFLHLNHTNPLWRDPSLHERVRDAGFGVAARGERVDL